MGFAAATSSPAGVSELAHSVDAEQFLLGALLNRADALNEAGDLPPGSFFVESHEAIYRAVQQLAAAGVSCDPVSVAEQLKATGASGPEAGLKYLNELSRCTTPAGKAKHYADIVRQCALSRRVAQAMDALAAEAAKSRSPTDFIARAFGELTKLEAAAGCGEGLPLLGLAELRDRSALTSWLVKGVVPAVSIGALFGASQTFKSFMALDMGLHVAHGMRWMGRKTAQAPVVYIAAEGGAGLWRRIDAWHRQRQVKTDGLPFYTVPAAVELGTEASRVVQAARRLAVRPGLVIVDTLSQTFSGDENAAAEMAAFLRHLGQQFRDLWQCSVLLVHHSGHSATERPRGSSALTANLDYLLGAHRDEREMLATLSCAKAKDADPFPDASFALKPVQLGLDEDGDPVTSLVAWHLASAEEVAAAEQAEQAAGRAGRGQALLTLVQNGEPEKALRRAFYEQLGDMPMDSKKKAYYRARDAAVARGQIEVAEGIVIDLRGRL